MIRAFVNPILLVALFALMFVVQMGELSWSLPMALSLSVVAFFANLALAMARALTARPFFALAAWSFVYLAVVGVLFSSAWIGGRDDSAHARVFERDAWVLDSVAAPQDREELYLLLSAVAEGREFAQPLDAHWSAVAAHVAVEYGRRATLARLLKSGVSPNACYEGVPLLMPAVYAEDLPMIRLLLEAGANPNYALADGDGFTPFMAAVMGGDRTLVRLLLEAGGDPSIPSASGRSALDVAPYEAMRTLLQE